MAASIPIEIYDEFSDDFVKLTDEAQSEVKDLLVQLQDNPYEPELQKQCFLHDGERFEYPLDGGVSIFWKVHHPSLSVTKLKMTVWLEKIAPTSKLKKK